MIWTKLPKNESSVFEHYVQSHVEAGVHFSFVWMPEPYGDPASRVETRDEMFFCEFVVIKWEKNMLRGIDNLNIFSTSLDLFIYKYLLVKNIGVNKRSPKIYSPTFSSLIYNLMDKLRSLNIFRHSYTQFTLLVYFFCWSNITDLLQVVSTRKICSSMIVEWIVILASEYISGIWA